MPHRNPIGISQAEYTLRGVSPCNFITTFACNRNRSGLYQHFDAQRKLNQKSIPISARVFHEILNFQLISFLRKRTLNKTSKGTLAQPATIPQAQLTFPSNCPATTLLKCAHSFTARIEEQGRLIGFVALNLLLEQYFLLKTCTQGTSPSV